MRNRDKEKEIAKVSEQISDLLSELTQTVAALKAVLNSANPRGNDDA